MNEQADIRKGVASASGMARVIACNASFLREQALYGIVPDSKNAIKAAARGNVIHEALHKSEIEKLSYSDRICAERIMFMEAEMVEKYEFEGARIVKEERYWYTEGELFEPEYIFSGQPDTVHLLGNRGMVVNYKTGHYTPHLLPMNWQMITECTLAAYHYQLEEVVAVLLHPNCDKTPEGLTRQHYVYSGKRLLEKSLPILIAASRAALKEGAKATPGKDQCLFCRAAKNKSCEEYMRSDV